MKYKNTFLIYFAKHGSFHEDFVPIKGDVLFVIDTRFVTKMTILRHPTITKILLKILLRGHPKV